MKLKIMMPEKLVIEDDVDSVTLPATLGQMTVMAGHDIMLVMLKAGVLYYRKTDPKDGPIRKDYSISGGFAEVTQAGVHIYIQNFSPTPVKNSG